MAKFSELGKITHSLELGLQDDDDFENVNGAFPMHPADEDEFEYEEAVIE